MDAEQLAGLIDTLELLVAQVRAYERALPAENHPARAAISVLGELSRQALNEAQDLAQKVEIVTAAAEHPFSPREHQVIALVAKGMTNKEIAYHLGLSERTIQFHVNSIFNKTDTSSRTEAVAVAMRNKWI